MNDKLQKLLAHAGYGSRREIETWITDGRITVNGKRAKLGDRAEASDRVLVDGKMAHLTAQQSETIKALIYHKPEGEICSRNDPQGRPTIFDNLPGIPGGRWVSVGRLDINTSGLIILTNNGELANKLMHPSTGLEREYLVRIRGQASSETIKTLTRDGVDIDGKPAKFDSVTAQDMSEEGTNHWYRVVIREGRYREVRKLWDAVGHSVSRLKRIRYGTIRLTRDIKRGKHSKIAPMQLEKLVTSVDLQDEFGGQLYSSRSAGSKPAARSRTKSNFKPRESNDQRDSSSSSPRNKPQSRSRVVEPSADRKTSADRKASADRRSPANRKPSANRKFSTDKRSSTDRKSSSERKPSTGRKRSSPSKPRRQRS